MAAPLTLPFLGTCKSLVMAAEWPRTRGKLRKDIAP